MNVHLVVGWPRCGTSVLVRAVDAGGIPAVNSARPVRRRGGYRDQPDGYWQPPDGWHADRAQVDAARGRVAKVLARDAPDLVAMTTDTFRVAMIVRDPVEVLWSHHASTGSVSRFTPHDALVLAEEMGRRPDVADVAVVDHRDLMMQPEEALGDLFWPIDPAAGAAVVDLSWWRWRNDLSSVRQRGAPMQIRVKARMNFRSWLQGQEFTLDYDEGMELADARVVDVVDDEIEELAEMLVEAAEAPDPSEPEAEPEEPAAEEPAPPDPPADEPAPARRPRRRRGSSSGSRRPWDDPDAD